VTRAITLKELKVLWASPLPYVLGAVFHATLGVLAWGQIGGRGQAVFQPVVPIAGFLLVLVTPILSARSFAEEASRGTLDVLLAVPVRTARLVAGKYLAVVVTVLMLLAPISLLVGLLFAYGDPDPGPVLTGMLGLAVLGASMAAVGVLASSLTSSQPVAAVLGLFAVLALWFAHVGSEGLPTAVVAALSISERLRSFASGVIDLADGVFFASLVVVALAGAVAAVESRRRR
jgi:ABC-2 type transport system permease protein